MVYVGMTRAKNNLSVHFDNADIFTDEVSRAVMVGDDSVYGSPEEVLMQLSHRDVVLDMFKGNQNLLRSLHSGTRLELDGDYLSAEIDGCRRTVLKFSASFREKLAKMASKDIHRSRPRSGSKCSGVMMSRSKVVRSLFAVR